MLLFFLFFFFFFNDTATTEIYTLSLHDALPIYRGGFVGRKQVRQPNQSARVERDESEQQQEGEVGLVHRSEEHTSELQSRLHLVCRLLLEKKKKKTTIRRNVSTKDDTEVC